MSEQKNERYLLYQPEYPWPAFGFRRLFRLRYWLRCAKYILLKILTWFNFPELYYHVRKKTPLQTAGTVHCEAALNRVIRESVILGRVAVIPTFRIPSKHNFGYSCAYSPEEYYDLSKSYARYRGQKIPIAWLSQSDFLKLPGALRLLIKSLIVHARHFVTPEKNTRHALVVRKIPPGLLISEWLYKLDDVRETPEVHLELQAGLTELAMAAVSRWGDYDCLHLRAPDFWNERHAQLHAEHWPSAQSVAQWTQSIEEMFWIKLSPDDKPELRVYGAFLHGDTLARVLPRMFKPGRPLFVMTNLCPAASEKVLAPLHNIYEIHQSDEVPELNRLVSGSKPDNIRLFLIERVIAKHAAKTLWVHWRNYREMDDLLRLSGVSATPGIPGATRE